MEGIERFEYWVRESQVDGLDCFMPVLVNPDNSGYVIINGMNYITDLDGLLAINPGIRAVLDYDTGEPVYISDQHKPRDGGHTMTSYSHPYTVIVQSLLGGPRQLHRFRSFWQADAFYAAMVKAAEDNGQATTVTLMHGDECVKVY